MITYATVATFMLLTSLALNDVMWTPPGTATVHGIAAAATGRSVSYAAAMVSSSSYGNGDDGDDGDGDDGDNDEDGEDGENASDDSLEPRPGDDQLDQDDPGNRMSYYSYRQAHKYPVF